MPAHHQSRQNGFIILSLDERDCDDAASDLLRRTLFAFRRRVRDVHHVFEDEKLQSCQELLVVDLK